MLASSGPALLPIQRATPSTESSRMPAAGDHALTSVTDPQTRVAINRRAVSRFGKLGTAHLCAVPASTVAEGSACVRSTGACCARSRRWRRCSLRRSRLAYMSPTHSATGAFHGCCGDGWFFSRLRGLKPSSFAMRTSAGESRQRRAASAHALQFVRMGPTVGGRMSSAES